MKDPAFLFYSSDFLTGCANLTMEERGQYITLLCLEHQLGRLSEKTIRLSVGSVSVDVLAKFKQDENGLLYNERLEIEIEKRSNFINTRRTNGLKGGRPKAENKKPNGLANGKPNGKANEKLIENENVIEIINSIKDLFDEKYLKNDKTKVMFDKLLKKYSKDEILKATFWARNDDFWKTNFCSPMKLEKKNKEDVTYIDVFLAKAGNYKIPTTEPTKPALPYEGFNPLSIDLSKLKPLR
jgi:hypothetical protein